jgi:cell division protein ZapA
VSEPAAPPVNVRILEKDYLIACPPNERSSLLDSAAYLNARMKEIRDSGKIMGADRIAVMAALNMANELLALRERDQGAGHELGTRLKGMRERVESALERGQQLEL